MDTITLILSIIGALAWLPIVVTPIRDHFRKVQVVPLDTRLLINAASTSVDNVTKRGTILILVLNIYIRKTSIFAKNIEAKVTLRNQTQLKTELLNLYTTNAKNSDGSVSRFEVPREKEFNVSRIINADSDNIKYVAFLVENGAFDSIDEIEKIEMTFKYCNIFKKRVIIRSDEYPTFNSSALLSECEKIIYESKVQQ